VDEYGKLGYNFSFIQKPVSQLTLRALVAQSKVIVDKAFTETIACPLEGPGNDVIRARLSRLSDVELEAWFQDNYSHLAVSFGSQIERAARVNALIDLCLRRPEERARTGKILP
jgi:hypothetical protein